MSAPGWMPFHVGVYLADTGHLSTLAHGAYILLILHYWQNDGLPTDDDELARIARLTGKEWAAVRGALVKLFKAGEWKHKRIDAELAAARQIMNKRSAAGKAGASARYGNRMANVQQSNAPIPLPSPEDISSSVEEEAARGPSDRFEVELRDALGDRAPPPESDFTPIAEMIAAGHDFVADVLPACRSAASKATDGIGSWRFYAVAIGRKAKAVGTPSEPVAWLPADSPRWGEMNKRSMTEKRRPLLAMGSMEASGVGAFVPKAWLVERTIA